MTALHHIYKGAFGMQAAEAPTKIYEPKQSDRERITELSQSNAPVKIYTPSEKDGKC